MEDVNSPLKESPGTESIAAAKEKEDRLHLVKERQNEERQRKLEELKAQALAAQKYREQKDEERRRRIDDMKARDADRRSAVEERKRAIEEADRDRREYLLRKNVDREARFDAKRRNDRSSAVFAFGSSTPRLLDPGEMGAVSPSNFWNHRRATSISNIAYSGQPLTRRSSERELTDGPKKRATSAGGMDRQLDAALSVHRHEAAATNGSSTTTTTGATRPGRIEYEPYKRRAMSTLPSPTMSTSMYEVFNWGYANESAAAGSTGVWSSTPFRTGKRMHFSIAGPQINIDDPPPSSLPNNRSSNADNCSSGGGGRAAGGLGASSSSSQSAKKGRNTFQQQQQHHQLLQGGGADGIGSVVAAQANDLTDSPQTYRSVARRKTDLMPTLPSPRDGMQFGSRSSLTSASHTPRSPGRAMSMTRLDQLSKPIRRNGEHICAIVEREKRMHLEANGELELEGGLGGGVGSDQKRMSRSMTHLAAAATGNQKRTSSSGLQKSASTVKVGGRNALGGSSKGSGGGGGAVLKPAKSLCHLDGSGGPGFHKIITKVAQHFIRNGNNARGKGEEDAGAKTVLRSGEVTPGGTGSSRPTSAMSSSTITSTVSRRSATSARKPRPISIAVTGVSLNANGGGDLMTTSCTSISSNHQNNSNSSNKLQKERPPLPKQSTAAAAASTNKRTPSLGRTSSKDSLMTRSMDLSKRAPAVAAPPPPPKKAPVKSATPLQSPGQESKAIAPKVEKQKSSEKVKKEVEQVVVVVADANPAQVVAPPVTDSAPADENKSEPTEDTVVVVAEKMDQLQLGEETNAEVTVVAAHESPLDETPTPTNNNNNVNEMFIEAEKHVAIANDQKILKEIENLEKQHESLNATVEETPVNSAAAAADASLLNAATTDELIDMTASMMAKSKITTEEEAKAALAERRRLARVEAERQAELERQRAEAEEEAERKRLMEEEERYRQMEVEANRLAQEARQAEGERLAQAIEEAQKKEEEERVKREEESRAKLERDEQERRAREEAEKQRLEMVEKLKKEEKEREERRKRVEAIMSRTRAKGSAPNTPVKAGEEEKSDESQKEDRDNIPQGEEQQQQPSNGNGGEDHETGFQGNNGSLKNGQQESYEKTVTDKENALLGSFDNHFISDSAPVPETNNNNLTTTTTTTTTMETAPSAVSGENGFHKNGIDNSRNSLDISSQILIDENNAKNLALSANQDGTMTVETTTTTTTSGASEQLIDFGGGDSMPHINNNANILNNNSNTTNTTTGAASQLVTDLPF